MPGNIQRRPNDKWRARYRDETGRERARHFDRKVDATRWLDEVTASLVIGSYVDPAAGRLTFRAYYEDWAARQVWVSGTEKAMTLAASRTPFRDMPMKSIKRSHVELWVKKMSADLAPGTVKTRFNNVRSVFNAACRDKIIAHNPTDDVGLPRQRRASQAMQVPTPSEVGTIVAAAEGWFATFVALCAFCGLRLGEAAALQRGDVDFLRRTMTVRRQVQRAERGRVEIRPPKYGSERTVYPPDGLLDMLAGSPGMRDAAAEDWLFSGPGGHPPHQNTVGHQWRQTLKRAGLTGYKLHDLRHFYASGLIAEGCDVVTVQRALGHAKPSTTLDTYSHLWPTAEDRTRAAAQDLLVSSLSSPSSTPRLA